jgi:hypothetical protein
MSQINADWCVTARGFTVGIVCALPIKLKAVRAVVDATDEYNDIADEDSSYYALGSMHGHNIVAACLP